MTEEVKPAEITAEEIKPEETKSGEDALNTTPEGEVVPDYEALYNEEKGRREKAEHKIVKMRTQELVDEPEVDEPKEDIKSYVDQRINEVKLQTQEDTYTAEINKISTNESEKKLIRLLLEDNNLSGDIKEQVQKAKALANYKKVAQDNKELAISLTANPGGEDSSSYKPKTPEKIKGLSPSDVEWLKKQSLIRGKDLLKAYQEKYGS